MATPPDLITSRKTRPTVAVLRENPARYQLIADVPHADLVPAVQKFLKQPGIVKTLYYTINICAFIAMVVCGYLSGAPLWLQLPNLCLGFAGGYLVLLPVHEHIHALTYRVCGAKTAEVRYNLRRLTAYCTADGFVADGREFTAVCLMPFLVINTVLAGIMVTLAIAFGQHSPMLWGALLLHIGACSGDAAFANLTWPYVRNRTGFWTYDDVKAGRTAFFTDAEA